MRYVLPLMFVYLALMAGLALQYDWQFFMNDAIAIAIFAIVAIGLFIFEHPRASRR